MRKRPFAVERWRGKNDLMMQRTLDAHRHATASASERNRRDAMAEACREDLREILGRIGCRADAALYVAELRLYLNEGVDLAAIFGGAR